MISISKCYAIGIFNKNMSCHQIQKWFLKRKKSNVHKKCSWGWSKQMWSRHEKHKVWADFLIRIWGIESKNKQGSTLQSTIVTLFNWNSECNRFREIERYWTNSNLVKGQNKVANISLGAMKNRIQITLFFFFLSPYCLEGTGGGFTQLVQKY